MIAHRADVLADRTRICLHLRLHLHPHVYMRMHMHTYKAVTDAPAFA
jgi:hypothetical protein